MTTPRIARPSDITGLFRFLRRRHRRSAIRWLTDELAQDLALTREIPAPVAPGFGLSTACLAGRINAYSINQSGRG